MKDHKIINFNAHQKVVTVSVKEKLCHNRTRLSSIKIFGCFFQLGAKCVEVGWEVLQDQFLTLMDKAKKSKDHDNIFDNLKAAVVDEAMHRY